MARISAFMWTHGVDLAHLPPAKFAKVMFSQVSVCPQGGACGAWASMAGGGACVAGPILKLHVKVMKIT